jgi:type I restriction enzyme M protein
LLYLKYLDRQEQDKLMKAELGGSAFTFILDEPYRWESWAGPKILDGKRDRNKALIGDALRHRIYHQAVQFWFAQDAGLQSPGVEGTE